MDTMRDRFIAVTAELLNRDPHVAVILADIGVGRFEDIGAVSRHPHRIVNVGIREQAMVGVAAGMALSGLRPIVHTYAPFLVERAYEQLKLDLSHQDLGAVLVSVGASYDASTSGRTHHAPGDVGAIAALPGWNAHVPGHPDEVEAVLRAAVSDAGRTYIRLADETNAAPHLAAAAGAIEVLRQGSPGAPTVLAVGPTLEHVLQAIAHTDVTVGYTITPHPLDAATLRTITTGTDVVVVEPYLQGTSAAAITSILSDRPIRLRSLGVPNHEFRHYGSAAEHRAAHGLHSAGIRRTLSDLLTPCTSLAV